MIILESQVYGPVNHIKEKEGEWEQGSGIQIDPFGSRGNHRFWRRGLLAVLSLGFAKNHAGIDGLPVAIKVRQLKVPWERAHDAEVIGPKVGFRSAHLFAACLCDLETKETNELKTLKYFLNLL